MVVFDIKYELGLEYDNKVELSVRLSNKPSDEDLVELLAAITTLDTFAQKNLDFKIKPIIKEKK